jgi:hypothetical protein
MPHPIHPTRCSKTLLCPSTRRGWCQPPMFIVVWRQVQQVGREGIVLWTYQHRCSQFAALNCYSECPESPRAHAVECHRIVHSVHLVFLVLLLCAITTQAAAPCCALSSSPASSPPYLLVTCCQASTVSQNLQAACRRADLRVVARVRVETVLGLGLSQVQVGAPEQLEHLAQPMRRVTRRCPSG